MSLKSIFHKLETQQKIEIYKYLNISAIYIIIKS